MSLGQRLKEARLNKGWRQHNLAEALGVTVQAVSQWERDATHPSIQRVLDIAGALDIKFSDLLREYSPDDIDFSYPTPRPIPVVKKRDVYDFATFLGDFPAFSEVTGSLLKGQGKVFGIEITSDSMQPMLTISDIAIFDLGIQAVEGACVIVHPDGSAEAIIGIYRPVALATGDGLVSICPLNQRYPPTYFADIEDVVCATLIQTQRTFAQFNDSI